MKKVVMLALFLCIILNISACGKKTEDIQSNEPAATAVTAEPAVNQVQTVKQNISSAVCAHLNSQYIIKKESGCITEGEGCYTCANCGEVIRTAKINPTGHSYVFVNNENGHWAVCAVCGKDTSIEAHTFNSKSVCTVCGYGCKHSYSEKVTEPICTQQGYTTYTCKQCGYEYIGSLTPAAGHRYTTKIEVKATCTNSGSIKCICSVCADSFSETIKAMGHTPVTDAAVEATCTGEGLTEGSHCSVCGAVIDSQKTVPVSEHVFVQGKCKYCGWDINECDDIYKYLLPEDTTG